MNSTISRRVILKVDFMLVNVIVNLHAIFGDENKVSDWLNRPNKLFGEQTPLQLLHEGKYQKVISTIYAALEENADRYPGGFL